MIPRVARRVAGAALFAAIWIFRLHAHEPGLSVAEVRPGPDALEVRVIYALGDVRRWLPPYSLPAGADASPEASRAALEVLRPLLTELWELRVGSSAIAPTDTGVEILAGEAAAFRFRYAPVAGSVALAVRSLRLSSLPDSHRQVLRLFSPDGRLSYETTLTSTRAEATLPRGTKNGPLAQAATPSAGDFFKLGVEHIWMGYDHLLFLFGLLVVARTFRSVLVIISCFTLAHSITLAVATLGWVWLPPAFVEPAIAASIVFVGVENLALRGREPEWRGAMTFLFGLVHGFGFASVLRDLGVGSSGTAIAGPLVWFNLGVEAGQIGVAALALPLIAFAFRSETMRLRGGVVASILVSLAGLYWLAERTLG